VAISTILDVPFSNRGQQVDLVDFVGAAIPESWFGLAYGCEEVLGAALDPEDVADERDEIISVDPVTRCDEVPFVVPRPANGVARDLHVVAHQTI
jgi:hypothetical protein